MATKKKMTASTKTRRTTKRKNLRHKQVTPETLSFDFNLNGTLEVDFDTFKEAVEASGWDVDSAIYEMASDLEYSADFSPSIYGEAWACYVEVTPMDGDFVFEHQWNDEDEDEEV